MRIYQNADAVQFVEDMQGAGFPVEHYNSRFFWEGPAVRADGDTNGGPSLQEVIRATTVRVQWDTLGFGFIVYPVHGDKGIEHE